MTTDKGKSVTAHEVINTITKNMVIISKYEVEYKEDEDIFNNQ